jgi:hypothetical protein
MEAIDIEELNFDEYNREVYLGRNTIQNKKSNLFNDYSQAFDVQKRYKFQIDKYVKEYKSGLARNEMEETNLPMKKRKI